MGFLAPTMLFGGLAVSVPLVLHFFYKARYRRQPWAAMTFLKLAIEQTSRRVRFQELILLVLRCGVLLLLALALARPTFSGSTVSGRGESVDAVFVFDTSFSMTARDGEKTRLERAKDAALGVLDNLPPNSTVQMFACADRATPLGPVSPGNLDQARQLVAQLTASSLSTDFLPGLSEAFAALDRGAGANKEVYLFTDAHKQGWDRQSAAVRAKAEEIKGRAAFLIVRCGVPDRPVRNVSVADITYPGGIPHTGTRMPFTVLLRNTGPEAVRNVNVALEVDGRAAEKEGTTVEVVEPGQVFPVTLTAKLDEAGPRIVTATASGDDLPADNRLDRVVLVRDRVRVVVVDGAPDLRDPKESASHYVRNALVPVPGDRADDYFVRVTVVPADEAGPALLGACEVCVLANVPASNADRPGIPGLAPEFVARLAEFVKAGGGLIVGAGDHVLPGRYNAVLGSEGAKLLPFDLDQPTATPADKPFKIAPDTAESPSFLARFRDEPFRSVTAEVDLLTVMGVNDTNAPTARTLLRLTDLRPLVASKPVGEGEVIFVATSLDAQWGNWPAKAGSFVSMMQYALAHLTGKAGRGANRTAGEPLVYQPPEAGKFELRRPDGKRDPLPPPVTGADGRLTVTAADTPLAGVYQIGPDGDDPLKGPRFAVAPDLREADDLTVLSDGEIEQALGFRPVFLRAGTEGEVAAERAKREWTVWVLLAVFLLACGESVWAWFCGKAW